MMDMSGTQSTIHWMQDALMPYRKGLYLCNSVPSIAAHNSQKWVKQQAKIVADDCSRCL